MDGTQDTAAALDTLLARALERRAGLIDALAAEGTDAYRLFHGVGEGRPGLTVDRYGPLVLAQSFREPLAAAEQDAVQAFARRVAGATEFAHCDRATRAPSARRHRGVRAASVRSDSLSDEMVCRERGVRFAVRARHRGQDPWLFLDLREGRRRLAEIARGKSVLNLFAYTCGAGVAAAAAGAREVWNVDFSQSALAVGRRNAELNAIDPARIHFVQEDCLPMLRQLAGLPVKGRAAGRAHLRVDARRFDVVFLDPPAWSKGPFGAVDVERDYESLFKPALACTEPGGFVIATNHAATVELAGWLERLERCAAKAGRAIEVTGALGPGPDFPSLDGKAPLKIAVCTVR